MFAYSRKLALGRVAKTTMDVLEKERYKASIGRAAFYAGGCILVLQGRR